MVFKFQEYEIWESTINVEKNMGFMHSVLTLFSMPKQPSSVSMSAAALTGFFFYKKNIV